MGGGGRGFKERFFSNSFCQFGIFVTPTLIVYCTSCIKLEDGNVSNDWFCGNDTKPCRMYQ